MNEDTLFFLLVRIIFVLTFLMVVWFGLYKYRSRQRRRSAFDRLARELGFISDDPRMKHKDELSEVPGSGRGKRLIGEIIVSVISLFGPRLSVTRKELKALLSGFRLFKGFATVRIDNLLTRDSGRGKIYLFEGIFRKSSNRTYYRTALAVNDERLDLPECTVVPENLAKKVFKLFGHIGLDHKDIDLEFDPEFSSSYLIRGSEEFKVREIFNSGVCRWFVSQKEEKPHFESKGSAFVVYFETESLDIDKARALYFSAKEFLEMWAR